jgi:hypothetical protein
MASNRVSSGGWSNPSFPYQSTGGQHDAGCIRRYCFQRGQGGAALASAQPAMQQVQLRHPISEGGGDVVAFVDDHLPVALHHGVHLPLPYQRLHHRDVELAGGPRLAATDATDRLRSDIQEGVEPLLPLAQAGA